MDNTGMKQFLSKVFHNYIEDPIPAEMPLDTLVYIIYTPNPKGDLLVLRKVHRGLLPHIGGIKGWALPEDLVALFVFGIEKEEIK